MAPFEGSKIVVSSLASGSPAMRSGMHAESPTTADRAARPSALRHVEARDDPPPPVPMEDPTAGPRPVGSLFENGRGRFCTTVQSSTRTTDG
jgi:hypothetical protein